MSSIQVIQKRDKILEYIQATLTQGYNKKDAYLAFIDSDIKNVHSAINRLEKSKEYQEIYAVIVSDENYQFQMRTQKVKGKYLNLLEKNIDTADSILDDAKGEDLQTRGAAVRLANETLQALAVVSGGPPPTGQPGHPRLDKSGVIT